MAGASQQDAYALHQAGLGASRPRKKIYEYLRGNRTHPTAEQIYTAILPQIPTLSKMTVYNTLRAFTEKGICRDVRIEGGLVRYDPNVEDHGHFMCDKCGGVFDFPMPAAAFQADMLEGFEIGQRDIFFRGVCPDCLYRERNRKAVGR